jgi:hypothetical protein
MSSEVHPADEQSIAAQGHSQVPIAQGSSSCIERRSP